MVIHRHPDGSPCLCDIIYSFSQHAPKFLAHSTFHVRLEFIPGHERRIGENRYAAWPVRFPFIGHDLQTRLCKRVAQSGYPSESLWVRSTAKHRRRKTHLGLKRGSLDARRSWKVFMSTSFSTGSDSFARWTARVARSSSTHCSQPPGSERKLVISEHPPKKSKRQADYCSSWDGMPFTTY